MPLPALPAIATAVAKATPALIGALNVLNEVSTAITRKKNEATGSGYHGVAQTVAMAEKPLATSQETLTQLKPSLDQIQGVVKGLGQNPTADRVAKALDAAGISVTTAGSVALEAIKGVRSSHGVTSEALRVNGKEPAVSATYHSLVVKLTAAESEISAAGATVQKAGTDFAASATAR